ncbi:unnamed protein product [Nesidiocoris tenuis]|uniref:Uncharacterized protein n=1 Tax=Nesidiocoris tenuis TaxID=355587 RepID=A0A6H5GRT0_9HEMI|nr:unnamed protein product [Nesidiocoris tenuis]CAB0006835.1 unnamed protein product [Nesidiocoris tenuis]
MNSTLQCFIEASKELGRCPAAVLGGHRKLKCLLVMAHSFGELPLVLGSTGNLLFSHSRLSLTISLTYSRDKTGGYSF